MHKIKNTCDVVVIGAGSAGLVCSNIMAQSGLDVVLAEHNKMGGDCLNTGCVPSKALLHMSKHSDDYNEVRTHIQNTIAHIEPHDSVERYTGLGVTVVQETATLLSNTQVQIGTDVYTCKKIVIATGAEPFVPPIKGIDSVPYYTSDTIWDMDTLPNTMAIVGAGAIGCELAQSFNRLGVKVTLIDQMDAILGRMDTDTQQVMSKVMTNLDIDLKPGTMVQEIEQDTDKTIHIYTQGDSIKTDCLVVAIGRRPYTEGLGLDKVGITPERNGSIKVNAHLQTQVKNIYAIGDVIAKYQLTHMAGHDAWYASLNVMFSKLKKFKIPYKAVPQVIYTTPEVAAVGISPADIKDTNAYTVVHIDLSESDRAVADNDKHGFVKIIVDNKTSKLAGATIVANRAGEMLTPLTLCMQNDLKLSAILNTIHPYPSYAEIVKLAIITWKKQITSPGKMRLLQRFVRFIR